MPMIDHNRAVVRIADDTTADEIREAITNMAKTASRLPRHFVERKAALHAKIDALLDELEGKG
jgi:hypothetical protein